MARIPGQGSGWLADSTRFTLYARDHHACAFCGVRGGPFGAGLSADHVVSQERGGSSEIRNLLTGCQPCNSTKQDMGLNRFIEEELASRGHDPQVVKQRIRRLLSTPEDREEGRRLVAEKAARRKPPDGQALYNEHRDRAKANRALELETGEAQHEHPLDATLKARGRVQARKRAPAPAQRSAQSVQRGKRGGTFVVTRSGEKRYTGKSTRG